MDFYDVLLRRKTGKPCKDMFDSIFAGSGGGGGKPALVPWATGTDDQIVAMVNGYYDGKLTIDEIKSVWSIGDCRSVDLAAMEASYVRESHRAQTVELQILDFEHDNLTTAIGEKTKALITVDLKNCLRDATVSDTDGANNTEHGYINNIRTNVGGWSGCKRRSWCNEIFYGCLPDYIKNIVKNVDKSTTAGNGSASISTDSDYCFLLSEIEIFGVLHYSASGEGTQYALFAGDASAICKLPRWGGSAYEQSDVWFERSPYATSKYAFCSVSPTPSSGYNNANSIAGIAPAFCL